ncbi:MAG: hypothetical protein Q4B63_09080 [Clostridium perfringens]|nr:hypothetical protein [Clostridium perfringens]
MQKHKEIHYNLILKNFIRVLTIILCIFYLINNNLIHILGGILFLITSLGIDLILKLIKINLTDISDFILQSFIFLGLFLGKMYNIYAVFPWWDLFLHFISGILIGIVGVLILNVLISKEIFENLSPIFKALYAFISAATSASLWEIFEFAGDRLFGFNSQLNSLIDTMEDICICVLGGLIMSVMVYKFYKQGKFKFIGEVVESFSKINIKEEPNKFQ